MMRFLWLCLLATSFFVRCKGPTFIDLSVRFPKLVGNQVNLEQGLTLSQLTAPYLVVNFFAPDCPPCIKELPELKKFYEETVSQGQVIYVAIGSALEAVAQGESVDYQQAAQVVAPFVKQYQLPYPIYLADTPSLKSWRITGFPETFILQQDNQGNWQFKRKFISAVTASQLKNALAEP